MKSKPKIVVLHLKELIYTGIFLILGILLILLLYIMFRPSSAPSSKNETEETETSYIPGTYRCALYLSDVPIEIVLVTSEKKIESLSMEELSEGTLTVYPLLQSTFTELSTQICETQSVKNLTYPEDSTYTADLIMEAITASLDEATEREP